MPPWKGRTVKNQVHLRVGRNSSDSYDFAPVDTAVSKKDLEKVANALTRFPDDFNLNSKNKNAKIENKAKNFKIDSRRHRLGNMANFNWLLVR